MPKEHHTETTRLEAFSDGVFAIIITIMVLELKVPHGADLETLSPLLPVFLSYVLSFMALAIYWNNHHHLMWAADETEVSTMWANMHLLFWLSLIPFTTGWMGENHMAPLPVAVYSLVLVLAAVAYSILQWTIVRHHGRDSALAKAFGKDIKGKLSILCYILAIPVAFIESWLAFALFVGVTLLWVIPDKRLEKWLRSGGPSSHKHERHR